MGLVYRLNKLSVRIADAYVYKNCPILFGSQDKSSRAIRDRSYKNNYRNPLSCSIKRLHPPMRTNKTNLTSTHRLHDRYKRNFDMRLRRIAQKLKPH